MTRRFITLVLGIVLILAATTVPAFGWANGADQDGDGLGDNGYGTHDWVLDQALRLAGEKGAWVQPEIARLKTDDPDTVIKDTYNHLYQNTNNGQGAPQRVSDLYYRIVNQYAAGDYKGASENLGLLTHYYSDVSVPYHTIWDPADEKEHHPYEYTVDDFNRSPTDNQSWITPRTRKTVTDVRALTLSSALAARADYSALRAAFVPGSNPDSHGNFSASASSVTGAITRARLSRAVNDLADIIAAVPTGQGTAKKANITKLWTFRRYVGRNSNVAAYALVKDSSGKPLRGVRVTYEWAFSSGVKRANRYTNADGLATLYQNMGGEKLWYKVNLTAKASTNASESVRANWVMPTPLIGYIKTTLSNRTPRQYTRVYARTKILDSAGRPIKGLPVTFSWKFKTKTIKYVTQTDAYGNARSSHNIRGATKGYRVYVRAQTQSANYNRSSTSSFVPR